MTRSHFLLCFTLLTLVLPLSAPEAASSKTRIVTDTATGTNTVPFVNAAPAEDATAPTALGLQVGGTERLRVTATGSVGIGTTTPSTTLDVVGQVRATGGLKYNDGTVQTTAATSSIKTYSAIATTSQTIASTTPVVVTGLSITLTPSSASSKFLISAVVNGSMNYVSCSFLYRNGASVSSLANNLCGAGSLATTYFTSPTTGYMYQHFISYMDAPGTTSSVTYDIRHMSAWGGSAYTTYVNNRDAGNMSVPSTLNIIEFVN